MVHFIRYWRLTPTEYRELTVAEHGAMVEVMKEENRELRRRQAKAKR